MPIKLTHQLTAHSGLMRSLIAQGAENIEDEMAGVVDDVVREVESIIRDEFNNSRTGFLSKGDTKLLGSIRADVSNTGSFPVVVSVWSEADEAKVASLERGARPHPIPKVVGDTFLYFPSARIGRGKAAGVGRSRGKGVLGPGSIRGGTGSRGGVSNQVAKVSQVNHPGNRPFRFMRQGLNRAIRNRLGRF